VLPITVLRSVEEDVYPDTRAMYLEDRDKRLTIDQVSDPKSGLAFQSQNRRMFDFGISGSAYWVRFQVRNDVAGEEHWILGFSNPHLYNIALYTPQPDGGYSVRYAGTRFPFPQREIQDTAVGFRLSIPTGATQTYYVRVETERIFRFSLSLKTPLTYAASATTRHGIAGAYYGVVLMMALYNLFLFVSTRDRSYLWYVLFFVGVSMSMSQLALDGYAFQYLWPYATTWAMYDKLVFGALAFMFNIQFIWMFLCIDIYVLCIYWL